MPDKYTYIKNLIEQLPEIPPDSIVSRTYYEDKNTKAILFGFAPGQELSEHTASRPAILHFVTGEAQVSLGKDVYEVKPGAWVHMPPNLSHSIKAKTKLVMILLLLPVINP